MLPQKEDSNTMRVPENREFDELELEFPNDDDVSSKLLVTNVKNDKIINRYRKKVLHSILSQ